MLHRLFTCHFHLIKNMIIGTAYQDTGLSHTHITDKLEVLLICTDPAGNLRELIASLHTFLNSITVFLTVKEKFRSTNPSFRSAQLMKVIINPYDLLSAVWCSGLLAITKCRVGDPDIIWHMMWNDSVVECNLRYFRIWKKISEYIGSCNIHKRIHMLL